MAVFGNFGPFVVGEDVGITDTVTVDGTATGTPVNVTGWGGVLNLYTHQGDLTALYSTAFSVPTGTDGKLTATIPNATTKTLADRAYFYEFRRTDNGANTVASCGWVTFIGG